MAPRGAPARRIVSENRRARFDYELQDTFEAGIALTGTEVKSLRGGKASLAESYAGESGGEMWLFNANIPEYGPANRFNHEPKRPRKLLLHKREIGRLMGAVNKEGMTVVPLKLYFDPRGMAKLEIAVARGKKQHDKRQAMKERSWQRDKARILKENN
ncbi:SsrA-binding protein SmpB [Lutibaculum baratangense]|uniref:SsrA-binding protein n=1 Tax=Lutibaculum baratangense AMV1 TaxID=631454 RepID=V4T9N8_9HYPH|nr:SsrA-binding protein SmpB [Lutibaculum baratangense]ESR23228.1 tmRNA-binding protein SmpB [Lutibaculum baratangense AMV1]